MSFLDNAIGAVKGRSDDESDIFGGGPPEQPADTKAPIGVAEDYVAVVQPTATAGQLREAGTPSPIKVRPRYFDGDEYKPAQLSPGGIAELQRQMAEAGLLGSDSFRLGVWDSTSVAAYRKLLEYANSSGLSDRQAILRYGAGQQIDMESQRAPLVVQTSNPEDLRRVFRQAVIDQLGQGWSQDKINGLVAAYQAKEASVQRQAYDMALTGGTVTNIPSPEAFIEARVMEQDPTGVQVRDTLDYVGEFMRVANSPAWSGMGVSGG